MNKRTLLTVLAGIVLAAGTTGHAQKPSMHAEIHNPAKFDMGEDDLDSSPGHEVAVEHRPLLNLPRQSQGNNRPDGALQSGSGPAVNTTDGIGFDGVAANGWAPPDTNMAIGPNYIVQWVNIQFAIYDKAGHILTGYPKPGNAFWSGFGGQCELQNSGDPIIQYDAAADRWIATQFTTQADNNGLYYQCFAISQTADPTGLYNRYSYSFSQFPDYPKITVWKNAYFASYNIFANSSGGWVGPRLCAYDRAAMLAGTSAVQECFNPLGNFGSIQPSDIDGGPAFAPPTNTGYFLDFGSNSLALWRFTPDFVNPANATLVGPISLPAASFSPACGGGTCIPQQGGPNLDSLADRLMYRLAYRNFGSYETMVVNQSVTAGSSVGIRWYEIRNPGGASPTIFQQGTYAPDAAYRWMGSAAMDKVGNIAIGYSTSSSTTVPSIRYTGRNAGDPLGTLQAELVVITSGAAQSGISRWGDYSAMRIDPSDDCTFWYTTEYISNLGHWRTRINSFKFNSCGGSVTPDFNISASPASQNVVQGNSVNYAVTVAAVGGFSGNVTFSTSGLPVGASASFNPTFVPGFGGSTMMVSTAATLAPGNYPFTVTGTNGAVVHSTGATLVVQAVPPPGDFSLSATPTSATIKSRQSASFTITINKTNGFNGAVSFSVSGLPQKTTASFSPTSSTTSTVLTVKANPNAKTTPPTVVTITGTSGALSHPTQVTIAVQ